MRANLPQYACALLFTGLCALAARADQVASQTHAGVTYVLMASPNEIRRYDLAARSFLPPLALTEGPTALLVDDSGIYVALGRQVTRRSLAGGAPTHLANASAPVRSLLAWNDFLYLVYPAYPYGNFLSVDKASGIIRGTAQFTYDAYIGASMSATLGKIYGRDEGLSPDDIQMLTLNADGTFGTSVDSPYHGAYPGAAKTWCFPGGLKVADNAGIIYNAADLTFSGSFAGGVTDLAFIGDTLPVVLRNNEVIGFSQAVLETGRTTLASAAPQTLAVHGTNLFAFTSTATDTTVEIVPTARLNPPEPGAAIDPRGLAYVPDQTFMDRDGTVLLHSKNNLSLFRWSVGQRAYAATIPLTRTATHVAYSPDLHRVFLGQESGQISQIRLADGIREEPFAASPQRILGMASVGNRLMVCDAASPWVTHYVYDGAGTRLSSRDWNHFSRSYEWSPANRRLYFFRDDTSPNDLLSEEITTDGQLQPPVDSPYHGELLVPVHPIRPNGDGSQVLLGSGQIFDGSTLQLRNSLANPVGDAVWMDGRLVTVREIGGGTQVQSWRTDTFAPVASRQLAGPLIRLLRSGESLVAITAHEGAPRFHLLDGTLAVTFSSPVLPAAPSELGAANIGPDSVELIWHDGSDNEDKFVVEQLNQVTGIWQPAGEVAAEVTRLTVTGLPYLTLQEFRVRAVNSVGSSAAAGPLAVRTLPDPRSPLGPPFELRITRVLGTSAELAWRDNATNEDGFKLERRAASSATWTTVFLSGPNVTAFTDPGLAANRSYFYRVSAFNAFSPSELSPELRVTTLLGDQLPPADPANLNAGEAAPTQVTLRWDDRSSNEDGFTIWRAEAPAFAWSELGRTPANANTYVDATAKPGTAYRYGVGSFNAFGGSEMGAAYIHVTTPPLGGNYLGMSQRQGDLVYLAFDGPNRIERFDLAGGSWLASLPLPETPTAFRAEAEGLYLSYGRRTIRLGLDGTGETFLANSSENIRFLFTHGERLYLSPNGTRFLSLNRQTGALIAEASAGWYSWQPGIAVAPTLGRVFAASAGVSPADVIQLELKPDGSLGNSSDSPYHGGYPIGTAVYLYPDEHRLVDNSGILYNTGDLSYQGSLGGAFDDLVFHGADVPVILRDRTLVAFSNTLIETGRRELPAKPVRIFLAGGEIAVFTPDRSSLHGLAVTRVPLAELNPAEPGEASRLAGLKFSPEDAFLDRGNVLHLFSQQHAALFRWSPAHREELDSYPLASAPKFAAYSATLNRFYFARANGVMTQIRPEVSPREEGFATLGAGARGLATAGEYVFAVENSGAWGASHVTFDQEGRRLDYRDWNYYSRTYVWNPALRRMFFFRDDTSPNDLHFEEIGTNGKFGAAGDSPYHGELAPLTPIRVRPDGGAVLLGSGIFYDATTLTRANSLPNEIRDAAWRGAILYTVREIAGLTQVQRWSSTFAQTATAQFDGQPLRIWTLPTGLLVLTVEAGQPRMTLLDYSLGMLYQSPVNLPPTGIVTVFPPNFSEGVPAGNAISILQAVDPNPEDVHRFELVDDVGGLFEMLGDSLALTRPVDREVTQTLSPVIRVVDPYGESFTRAITFTVLNENEPPTAISLTPDDLVPENATVGSTVAQLQVADPDVGDTHTLSLLDDLGGRFRLQGSQVVLKAPLSFATASSHVLRVRATDAGGLSLERNLTVKVVEVIPQPPTGEVVLRFESGSRQAVTVWNEAGFTVRSGAFELIPSAETNAPAAGSGHLRAAGVGGPLTLRHRSNLPFQLLSMSLAELGSLARVTLVRETVSGTRLTNILALDGVADGSGPLRDFQEFQVASAGVPLTAVSLSGDGFALDDATFQVGADPALPVVRISAVRNGFEPTPGMADVPPFPHTARALVRRLGSTASRLTVQLGLTGTATYFNDYFIEGLGANRTVTFEPGESDVMLEIFPLPDSVNESAETVVLNVLSGSAHTIGTAKSAVVTLHDTAFGAWLAVRWPGATDGPHIAATGDPDGNGLDNFTEFALGADPANSLDRPKPWAEVSGGRFRLHVPRSRLATAVQVVLETAADLEHWFPLDLGPSATSTEGQDEVLHYELDLEPPARFVRWGLSPKAP